jgi:hypothetical protein
MLSENYSEFVYHVTFLHGHNFFLYRAIGFLFFLHSEKVGMRKVLCVSENISYVHSLEKHNL